MTVIASPIKRRPMLIYSTDVETEEDLHKHGMSR
jgi:hypothetical protein